MKKKFLFTIIFIIILGLTSACSTIEKVNNSINYIQEATSYINTISTFANDFPTLLEKLAEDQEAFNQLQAKLDEVEKEIKQFNQLTPPEFAKDVHAQILEHNQALESAIELYNRQLEEGQIDPAVLQNSELMDQLSELSKMIEQIQRLGG